MKTHKTILRGVIFLLVLLSVSQSALAQAIPLKDLRLNIRPRYAEAADQLGAKTIQITQSGNDYKIVWYSLVKMLDESAVYPTYKVRSMRGMLEVDSFKNKTTFLPPGLWGNGFARVHTALPLWLDPAYLDLKGRDKRQFSLGVLGLNSYLLKIVPDDVYSKLSYFQNLYGQFVVNGEVKESVNLSRSTEKDLRRFVKEFFFVRRLAKTEAEVYVNRVKEKYPAQIIGNRYFQIVVVDDPLNPLVLNLKIDSDKVPKVFKDVFKDLQSKLEYSVTNVSY